MISDVYLQFLLTRDLKAGIWPGVPPTAWYLSSAPIQRDGVLSSDEYSSQQCLGRNRSPGPGHQLSNRIPWMASPP